jgi:hypothetical protein
VYVKRAERALLPLLRFLSLSIPSRCLISISSILSFLLLYRLFVSEPHPCTLQHHHHRKTFSHHLLQSASAAASQIKGRVQNAATAGSVCFTAMMPSSASRPAKATGAYYNLGESNGKLNKRQGGGGCTVAAMTSDVLPQSSVEKQWYLETFRNEMKMCADAEEGKTQKSTTDWTLTHQWTMPQPPSHSVFSRTEMQNGPSIGDKPAIFRSV